MLKITRKEPPLSFLVLVSESGQCMQTRQSVLAVTIRMDGLSRVRYQLYLASQTFSLNLLLFSNFTWHIWKSSTVLPWVETREEL